MTTPRTIPIEELTEDQRAVLREFLEDDIQDEDVELSEDEEVAGFATIEVPVAGHLRATEHGVSRVRPHMREVEVSLDSDPFEGYFDIPTNPKDAAAKEADARIALMRRDLDRMERFAVEDPSAFRKGESPTGERLSGPMWTSLWREQNVVGNREGAAREEALKWFKHDDPDDARLLGLARGDRRYRAAFIRHIQKNWERTKLDMVDRDQVALMERESREVFREGKIAAAAKVFGLPHLMVAFDKFDHGPINNPSDTPAAEFHQPNIVVTYEISQARETRLDSDPFTPGLDLKPRPGQTVTISQPVTPEQRAEGITHQRGFKSILRHEYGHMVAFEMSGGVWAVPPGFDTVWRRYHDDEEARRRSINENPDLTDSEKIVLRGMLSESVLSSYSLQNASEGWAETFAIVTHPEFDRAEWEGVLGEELLDWAIEQLAGRGAFVA